MPPQLVVVNGPDQGRSFTLTPGQSVQIGRSSKVAVKLTDDKISRVHFEINWEANQTVLFDFSSSGTAVNGKRVTKHVLKPGDTILLGKTEILYQDGSGTPKPESRSTPTATTKESPEAIDFPEPIDLGETLIGNTIKDYLVQELIQRGVRGLIFKAQDKRDRRYVALKVLHPEITANEEEIERFVQAMKVMLPLRHPNVVTVYNAGRSKAHCWIAMQLVEGDNLARFLVRSEAGGLLDWKRAHRILVELARGLEYLHSTDVVHCNIAPQNILIRRADQTALLSDFQCTRSLQAVVAKSSQGIQGDFTYLPPEQVEGAEQMGIQGDLYSLGASMYTALTGQAPFSATSIAELIQNIRWHEPKDPAQFQPNLPKPLRAVIIKLMAKQPRDRYSNATELLEELDQIDD